MIRALRLTAALAAALAVLAAAAAPAPAAERDAVVRSFDGTPIVASFFTADGLAEGQRAPTILMGPGWSSGRARDSSSRGSAEAMFGGVSVRRLRAAGYNVLTWDPRGFGQSGGTVSIDGPDAEGRDVQALLDFAAEQPEAQLDAAGDPRAGMAGVSYGGGIQLVTAGIDRRVDAIVPVIAWHSLVTSLYKHQTFKGGWGSILFAAGVNGSTYPGLVPGNPAGPQTGGMDPHIYSAFGSAATGRPLSEEDLEWFRSRGPGELVERIRVPTLLVQGTVDTLFTLKEAVVNYGILRRNGVPVKMLWFCGGHGACLTDAGDTTRVERATIAWLDRWVKRDASIDTGPRFEWLDQHGEERSAPEYPLAPAGVLVGEGAGPLALEPGTRSGAAIAATPAAGALEVALAQPRETVTAIGAPKLRIAYRGTAAAPDTRVYAQLVDPSTGVVLGNQVTPVPVVLDGRERTAEVELETVAATVAPGRPVVLQLVPSSTVYDVQRSSGAVEFTSVRIELPLVDPAATVAADVVRLRLASVRGTRRGSRRVTATVRTARPVSGARVTVRTARGRLVGRTARGRSVTRRGSFAVRLRRPLRRGRYVVAVVARDAEGERVEARRRVRVR